VCAVAVDAQGATGDHQSASCKQVLRDRFEELHQDAEAFDEFETAGVVNLWLEEYLAYEVYRSFQDLYCDNLLEVEDTCVFANLANAENQHLKLIDKLIREYDLPAQEPPALDSTWWDEEYGPVVDQGTTLISALQAGLKVEGEHGELCVLNDVLGWSDPTANGTAHADVALIAQNLAAGDENHLRALAWALDNQGEDYGDVSWCMSEVEVEEILTTEMERHVVYDEYGEELATCGGSSRRGGF
jgi:hypothetical protein